MYCYGGTACTVEVLGCMDAQMHLTMMQRTSMTNDNGVYASCDDIPEYEGFGAFNEGFDGGNCTPSEPAACEGN